MDKIKRFIDCWIPVTTCTLRCPYCYIIQNDLFDAKPHKLKYSPQTVRRALSQERLGGKCLINMCAGGETLLCPEIVDYVRELLEEGHYVMIVTNATVTPRFEQLASLDPALLDHLFFKFSYHYLQLKERNLLDRFFANVKMMRDAGCSFTLEVTPHDELIPYADEMVSRAIAEVGAKPHFTIARDERQPDSLPILTEMSRDEYIKTWGKYDSSFFDYKMSIFEKKRNEFCYAGDWSFTVNLGTGIMRQCYKTAYQYNIFKNPDEPIPFRPIGCNCREHHCYNGHAFLVLGNIPELPSPTYGEIRNRKCEDGSEWLRPAMKSFMDTRLYESNEQLSPGRQNAINRATRTHLAVNKIKNGVKAPLKLLKK